MRKLTLDLDSLAVESFATDAGSAARGTVAGHAAVKPSGGCTWGTDPTCDGAYTCGPCAYTGQPSCGVDCNWTLDCASLDLRVCEA